MSLPMAKVPRPKILSTFMAEELRQEVSGKWIAIGLYTDVTLDKAPDPKTLRIFATATDLSQGTHEVSVVLIDLTHSRKIKLPPRPFEASGPDEIVQLILEMKEFRFPSSGAYRYEILIDRKRAAENYIVVEFPEEEDEAESGEPAASVAAQEDP